MNIKLLAALLVTASCRGAVTDADLQLLYRSSAGAWTKELNDGISSKGDAIEFLREVQSNGPFIMGEVRIDSGVARRLLQSLGDRETLEDVYGRYLKEPEAVRGRIYALGFLRTLHPEFIVVVARDLGKTSEKIELRGEFTAFEVPYANASLIMNIAANSLFFSSEVAAWARSVTEEAGFWHPELYLDDARAFWAENREKIEAGQYDLVQPPKGAAQPPAPATSAATEVTGKAPVSSPQVDAAKAAPEAIPSPPPAAIAESPASAPAQPSRSPLA